ncbi:helix-turn-helix domain-containing protein [Shewanella morhuae]|uniref:Predicted transcriptional regulator n=1 Tax=Shewanella morhuae TaxID=365591 RepID=A0A380C6X0_9GAMM|nr:helix-turn-helix domain-containing protein [Shewanella morhuae]SUJ13576.1 Predicted transcriptional regulator [Shewanella morhuae]
MKTKKTAETADWHRADVKAALEKRGLSLKSWRSRLS